MKNVRLWISAFVVILLAGCAGGAKEKPAEPEDPKKAVNQARYAIEEQAAPLKDVFEILWPVPLQDREFKRKIVNVQAADNLICVAGSDGIVFFVDADKGTVLSFYDPGVNPAVFPLTMGSYREEDKERKFVYLSTGGAIHGLEDPYRARGTIQARWAAKTRSAVITPLCNTPNSIFFGCADGKLYDLPKRTARKLTPTRMILRVKSNMKTGLPPISSSFSGNPFCIDDEGNLYRFDGYLGRKQKIIRSDVGHPAVPMAIDEKTGTLFIASNKYKLYALDADTGAQIKWVGYTGSLATGELTVHSGAVYFHTVDDDLAALSILDRSGVKAGERLWGGRAIADIERVLGPSKDGNLYLLTKDNEIAKLDVATGKILFKRPLPDVDFIISNPSNGLVYLIAEEGWIWALRER